MTHKYPLLEPSHSSPHVIMVDIPTVLSTLRQQVDEDLQPIFLEMEDLWERKLWYQLTEAVIKLFRDPRSEPIRFRLFESFISTFEANLNKLAFVSLAITASSNRGPQESLNFFTAIAADMEKDQEVWVYVELHIAQLYVRMHDLPKAKKIIDQCSRLKDDLPITNVVVTAAYYGTACEYYKVKNDYTAYYRHALLYLACITLDDLDTETKQARAYDLAVAALLGDKIYNFGELVMHPILSSLDGQYRWLQDLVHAVNSGDMKAFHAQRANLNKAPLLESNSGFLDQKICLMALCECVFKRGATDRILSFDTIAKETHLHAESAVEILLLKAFSMDLMRGSIDQIDKTVSISWLQPRILNISQIAQMRDKLRGWDLEVQNLGKWMHKEGESIWVN